MCRPCLTNADTYPVVTWHPTFCLELIEVYRAYWRKKKILFTILKEGKDFNMMSTATHFLSMLSAFIRRNIQLGHRLAPFTLRLSVIIMKVFQVTSSEICNIYALGTRPKKGSWCMTLCNILKRCVVTNVLFWIHFQYQKILAYDCVLICLKTILRTFLTSFKSNI